MAISAIAIPAVTILLWATTAVAVICNGQRFNLVSANNQLRSKILPQASNMQAMFWDDGLAASSQARANACPTAHGATASGIGENIAWGWPVMTELEAFQKWVDESTHYNQATNQCNNGQCGHYLQLVNAKTYAFGCGHRQCASFGQAQVQTYVCQYRVGGNQAGIRPYTIGSSCSACPSNLCVPVNSPNALFPDQTGRQTTAPPTIAPATTAPRTSTPATTAPRTSTPATTVPQTTATPSTAPKAGVAETVSPKASDVVSIAPKLPDAGTIAPKLPDVATIAPTPSNAATAPPTAIGRDTTTSSMKNPLGNSSIGETSINVVVPSAQGQGGNHVTVQDQSVKLRENPTRSIGQLPPGITESPGTRIPEPGSAAELHSITPAVATVSGAYGITDSNAVLHSRSRYTSIPGVYPVETAHVVYRAYPGSLNITAAPSIVAAVQKEIIAVPQKDTPVSNVAIANLATATPVSNATNMTRDAIDVEGLEIRVWKRPQIEISSSSASPKLVRGHGINKQSISIHSSNSIKDC